MNIKRIVRKSAIFLTPICLFILLSINNNDKKEKLEINILTYSNQSYNKGTLIGITGISSYILTYLGILLFSCDYKTNQNHNTEINQSLENEALDLDETESIDLGQEFHESYFINRDIRDASPTLSVPYKFIKKIKKRNDDDYLSEIGRKQKANEEGTFSEIKNSGVDDWNTSEFQKDWS